MFASLVPILLAVSGGNQLVGVTPPPRRCPLPPSGAQLWSEPSSWPGGVVPSAGQCVTIPAGQKIWLDVSPPPLGGLQIDGELVFECKNLALSCDWITVTGTLEIGSSLHAFHRHATVTLTDDFACSPTAEPQSLIVENGGVLRLIGARRPLSWVHLGASAAAGANQIVLDRTCGWKAGDRIAIASSDFDANQAEERTLVAVAGPTLTLDQPLTWSHHGVKVGTAFDGVGVDERAEIGLLTRNIVVRGTPSLDAQGHIAAGHVSARGLPSPAQSVEISWVEFRDLGNEGRLDEYPLHFDGLGDAPSSFVRGASFDHTYNRALAVTATESLTIEDCVDFDTIGHAFFIEDHAVRSTTWRRNLGLSTRAARPGFETLASDAAPATFYFRHPDNIQENNVAAGSDAYGFQLEVQDGEATPQKWFKGNVAHSCGEIGFFQDRRPHPSSPSSWDDLVAYKNRRYGVWWRSYGGVVLSDLRAADNRCAVYLASEGIQNDFVQQSGIADLRMLGGLVIGESTNLGTPTTALEFAAGRSLAQLTPNAPALHLPAWDVLVGVEVYDSLLHVDDVTFANFTNLAIPALIDRKAGAFSQVQHNSPWAIDPRNHASNLAFVNARPVWFRSPLGAYATNPVLGDDGIANAMIVDDDGSLTGLAGSRVSAVQPLLTPPSGSSFDPDWNAIVTAGAPAAPVAQLELANWMPLVNGLTGAPKLVLRRPSNGAVIDLVQPIYGTAQTHTDRYTANVVTGESYAFDYDASFPSTQWSSVFSVSLQFTAPGRSVLVSVPLPTIQNGSVQIDGQNGYAATSLLDLQAATSGWFFDASTGLIHFKLTTTGTGSTLFDGLRTTATLVAF
ncbi:MAG: G8 domain-containing protein [Planctomycetes bacterium]|nr:G8 domain-containing protein [Planctomycetota bacterium]